MTSDEILQCYTKLGYTISPIMLYDEEGIEGWLWNRGRAEYTSLVGEIPPEVHDAVGYVFLSRFGEPACATCQELVIDCECSSHLGENK